MIKVVHCISNFQVGGTELNMVRTLERLDRGRFQLGLIALKDEGPLRERIARADIPVAEFRFGGLGGLSLARRAEEVIRRLRHERPDVVHAHDRYTNTFIVPCARMAGVPLVIASRRWWTEMPNTAYRIGNRLAYRLAHCVLANSPAVARLMIETEGVPAERIVSLPNFVDDEAFADLPGDAIAAKRRSLGIPDGAFVVAAVAILRPEKDLESLIRAVALLRPRHPDLHLLIVGAGPREAALRAEAAASGSGHHVHFAGFLASPPNPHQYGDLSVLCSLHEGFPNSIVEAMAAARAVVATNVGGIPDAVDDGVTGLLVPPRAPGDLAEAIERLMLDDAMRASMGETARAAARAAYGASAVIGRLEEIYRLGGNRRAGA